MQWTTMMAQRAAAEMLVADAAELPEDEMMESAAEESGDASSDVMESDEQITEEGGEPQDPNIYQDFGPGGDQPSSYYGGGGGGGGGGGYQYQQPLPAATVAATSCADGLPPTSYDPTTGQPICTRTVTPAVVPLPADTPKAVRDFAGKVRRGVALTPGDVKRAADAAKKAGMPAVAGKIETVGKRVMTTQPRSGSDGDPQPTGRAGSSSKGGVRRLPTRGSSSKNTVPPRKLHGLEENMSGIGSFSISEVGVDGCGVGCDLGDLGDLGDEAEDFLYGGGGQDIYAPGPFSEEGQIPGYEMDEYGGGDYAPQESYQESYAEPEQESYGQQYAPSYPSYGPAPQQYQQPYAADPYGGQYVPQGYDPYAMQQGYQQSPYGYQQQMPYGYQDPYAQQQGAYDPYTGQPYGQQAGYGCQADPYTGQMPAYDPSTGQPCAGAAAGGAASLFPAGTPQVIIDAATAIMSGTATLQMVQQAVSTATAMGYAAVANQLIAMYQQYGGQYEAGAGTGAGTGRYCTTGEDPAVSGCIAKEGAATGGTYSFSRLPTDATACAAEAATLLKTTQLKAALKAVQAKSTLTAEQKAYYARYMQLKACITKGGGTPAGGVKGTVLTAAQTAANCKVMKTPRGSYILCPKAGETVKPTYAGETGGSTVRMMARTAYTAIYGAAARACTAAKCGNKSNAWKRVKGWKERRDKAVTLPTTPVTADCYKKVIDAAGNVVTAYRSNAALNERVSSFIAAASGCGITLGAPSMN